MKRKTALKQENQKNETIFLAHREKKKQFNSLKKSLINIEEDLLKIEKEKQIYLAYVIPSV